MRFTIPWRVTNFVSAVASRWRYLANRAAHLAPARAPARPSILFWIPFYGYTGGSYAVVSTANLLSTVFDVSFLTRPTNVMNRYVSPRVRMVTHAADRYDFCIVEAGNDLDAMAALKRRGTRIIQAMHGAPDAADGTKNHGYDDEQVAAMMRLADSMQFISDVQLPFIEAGPARHWRKIPNFVLAVEKRRRSGAAGVVCDTRLPHKMADAAIRGAELSSASTVEVWGRHHGRHSTARVRWNGFSSDKQRMYDSFDVLVHMSRLENQPLVILEALSAGIPCVLAPLPTYQFLRALDGIFSPMPTIPPRSLRPSIRRWPVRLRSGKGWKNSGATTIRRRRRGPGGANISPICAGYEQEIVRSVLFRHKLDNIAGAVCIGC